MTRTIAGLFLLTFCTSSVLAQDGIGLEELYRLDRLPALKQSVKVGSVSSYDRTGGNDDGFSGKYSFVRKDPEGLVLADLKGPGVIYRVWTPTPTDDLLEFLFDGESTPRIRVKFRDFFLGKDPDFPAPLVGFGAGGYYCYVPVPFAKSCIVRMRAERVQFYQINYALYPQDTALATFSRSQSPERREGIVKARDLFLAAGSDVSGYAAPPNVTVRVSASRQTLAPKSTTTLFETREGGRILGLRLGPTEALAGKARDLLLKIAFDGESPSVLCPLGDFFGYAWGQPAMKSLLVGTSGPTNYFYFPMPFARSAKVEVQSERDTPVQLHADVVHCPVPLRPDEGSSTRCGGGRTPPAWASPSPSSRSRAKATSWASSCNRKAWRPARRSISKETIKPPLTVSWQCTAPVRRISSMAGGMTCLIAGRNASPFR
jgi:hypothetical protein